MSGEGFMMETVFVNRRSPVQIRPGALRHPPEIAEESAHIGLGSGSGGWKSSPPNPHEGTVCGGAQ
jgi:hypothetical protein